ncbi:hypothetical protein PMAYCL1PPCAC_20817, partial [Pristionchus mayeri]
YFAADEIKEESIDVKEEEVEFKEEPIDEFDEMKQEEPVLNVTPLDTQNKIDEETMEFKVSEQQSSVLIGKEVKKDGMEEDEPGQDQYRFFPRKH